MYRCRKLTSECVPAICEMIRGNQDPRSHLLELTLVDCLMKDAQLAEIIDAILESDTFWPSLQVLNYAQNELGPLAIESLSRLLELDHFECDDPTYNATDGYCLKEISLDNL